MSRKTKTFLGQNPPKLFFYITLVTAIALQSLFTYGESMNPNPYHVDLLSKHCAQLFTVGCSKTMTISNLFLQCYLKLPFKLLFIYLV